VTEIKILPISRGEDLKSCGHLVKTLMSQARPA
jgi:hypothetical protein